MEGRKAKTHKGRKILEKRKGVINEDPKAMLFIKGSKTSETLTSCMKELVHLIALIVVGKMVWTQPKKLYGTEA